MVATVPFSPIDIDVGRVARGAWDPLTDRFRVWYIPGEGKQRPVCYVMFRKLDKEDGVVIYGHMLVNMEADAGQNTMFTVGLLSNDDIKARSMLNFMLGVPPSYRRRSEVRLIEAKWRSDQNALLRFVANVDSAMMNLSPGPKGSVYKISLEPSNADMRELARGMSAWWNQPT